MGVPFYYRKIVQTYPRLAVKTADALKHKRYFKKASNVSVDAKESPFDNFYLDLNALVHPICHPAYGPPLPQSKMVGAVCEHISRLVKIVRPNNLIYIALDGVAPKAKINQQRARRFVAARERVAGAAQRELAKDKFLETHTDEEFRQFCELTSWDSNSITPGTPFMDELARGITDFVIKQLAFEPTWSHLSVIFSDSNTPGEGEHKILEFIRKQKEAKTTPRTHVIFSADADLIFLALCTHLPNIFIMKEETMYKCYICGKRHFRNKCTFAETLLEEGQQLPPVPLEFFNVNEFRRLLCERHEHAELPFKKDDGFFINDYLVLHFLFGNDFLPISKAFDFKNNSEDFLMDTYFKLLPNNGYITANDQLNYPVLYKLFAELAQHEDEMLLSVIEHGKKCSRDMPFVDDVGFNSPGYVERYYTKLGLKTEAERNEFCRHYVDTMNWVFLYYTQGLPQWDFSFNYHHAPLLQEIVARTKDYQLQKFELGSPLSPLKQLLCVLPPESASLLPPELGQLITAETSPLHELYPRKFEIDGTFITTAWKAIPMLPWIDLALIDACFAEAEKKFTPEENNLNQIKPFPIGFVPASCSYYNFLTSSKEVTTAFGTFSVIDYTNGVARGTLKLPEFNVYHSASMFYSYPHVVLSKHELRSEAMSKHKANPSKQSPSKEQTGTSKHSGATVKIQKPERVIHTISTKKQTVLRNEHSKEVPHQEKEKKQNKAKVPTRMTNKETANDSHPHMEEKETNRIVITFANGKSIGQETKQQDAASHQSSQTTSAPNSVSLSDKNDTTQKEPEHHISITRAKDVKDTDKQIEAKAKSATDTISHDESSPLPSSNHSQTTSSGIRITRARDVSAGTPSAENKAEQQATSVKMDTSSAMPDTVSKTTLVAAPEQPSETISSKSPSGPTKQANVCSPSATIVYSKVINKETKQKGKKKVLRITENF